MYACVRDVMHTCIVNNNNLNLPTTMNKAVAAVIHSCGKIMFPYNYWTVKIRCCKGMLRWIAVLLLVNRL